MKNFSLLFMSLCMYVNLIGQFPGITFDEKNDMEQTSPQSVVERRVSVQSDTQYFKDGFFPVRKDTVAKYFYEKAFNSDRLSFVDNIIVQGNLNQGIMYSELVAGNIAVFRVSFGAMISAHDDRDQQEEALQKLVGGGGNSVLNIYYPLLYKTGKYIDLYWQLAPKFAGDIPALGSTTDNVTGNINLGSEFYLDISTEDKALNFFAYVRGGYIMGSKGFYENLNIDNKGLLFGQINFGFTLNKNIRISFTIDFNSTDFISL